MQGANFGYGIGPVSPLGPRPGPGPPPCTGTDSMTRMGQGDLALPACRGGLPGPRQPEFRRDWRIAITTAGLRGRLANSISRRRARRARPAPAGRQVSSPIHWPSVPQAHGQSVPRLTGRQFPGPTGRQFPRLTGHHFPPGPRAISSPGSRAVSLPGSRARLCVVSAPGSRAVRFQVVDNLAEAHGPGLVPAYPVGCLFER